MRKIGIYGGTFDPIHHGHLILARETLEKFNLEKIIFMPAAISPHKHAPPASGKLRLAMVRAAIVGEAEFETSTYELDRPPPSYTIETVEHCRAQYRNTQLYLLVGDDNIAALPTWRRFEELRQLVTIVVLRRAATPVFHEYLSVQRQIDISATEIRDRVAAGQSIRYLVPSKVEEIISREKLYQEVIQ